MTKEKSLSETDLEAYRKMFQEVGDFVEGTTIFSLWKLIPTKKEVLLKGELNVRVDDLRKSTQNILADSLELVSIANRFYLYWQFGDKCNVFLAEKPKNAKGLESLSKLFTDIINLFESQVKEVIMSGVRLYNDFILTDYSFLDIVEYLEKKDKYFEPCNFTLDDSKQEVRSHQLFTGYIDTDVLLGLLSKYDRKQFIELMNFKKEYLKQFKKVAFDFNEFLADSSQKEFDKIDRIKTFKQKLDSKGLIYP